MITERITVAFALTLCLAVALLALRVATAAQRTPSHLGDASLAAVAGERPPIANANGN